MAGNGRKLRTKGVGVVTMNGPEVERVRTLGSKKSVEDQGLGLSSTMVFNGNFREPVFFEYSAQQAKGLIQGVVR